MSSDASTADAHPPTKSAPPTTAALRKVDAPTLLGWLASGKRVLVIDVRQEDEIELSGRHFPGAIAVPVHQIFLRRQELRCEGYETVVTVSAEESRARAAAYTLSLLGCPDVRALAGGVEEWARRGYPLK